MRPFTFSKGISRGKRGRTAFSRSGRIASYAQRCRFTCCHDNIVLELAEEHMAAATRKRTREEDGEEDTYMLVKIPNPKTIPKHLMSRRVKP